MIQKNKKAIVLLSGGLDSVLAAKVMMKQGVCVEGIHFEIGFAKSDAAQGAGKELGIPLHIVDVIDEFKELLLKPLYDYGSNLNPCLDCKIFMIRKAKEWMDVNHFDFIVTGEVLGQRPKSQRRDTLNIVKRESGAEDFLLRPLTAKLLAPTLPEREGWVNREELYGFNGRSRKPQIALAKELGLTRYQQPAGGCLLTEPIFCGRMTALWDFRGKRDYFRADIELLQIGRHLRPKSYFRMIIGRDQNENEQLEKIASNSDYPILKTISHSGPAVLLEGTMSDQDVKLAAQIVARFSKGKNEDRVECELRKVDGSIKKMFVKPLPVQAIQEDWYV